MDHVTSTDGTAYEVTKVPVGFTLRAVCDEEQSETCCRPAQRIRQKATGQIESTAWRVFGRTLEQPKEGDTWTDDKGRFLGAWMEFFDPLGLGLSFPAELRRGDPWTTIVANYLKWPDDFRREDLADRKRPISRREGLNSDRHQSEGNGLSVRLVPKVIKSNLRRNYRLPGTPRPLDAGGCDGCPTWRDMGSSFSSGTRVNQPVPKERFTQKDIQERFGVGE